MANEKKNEKKELISIIVPVYGVEPYLRKCLDSIRIQTYPFLEVIVIDDESPDGCPGICDEYAALDKRFKAVHIKHAGLSGARNTGLDLACGAWIGFIDSDDWIEPEMYEKLLKTAKKYRADISYCGDRAESEGHIWGERMRKNEGVMKPEAFLTETLLRRTGRFNVWDKIYKASLFEGIRFPEGELFEDSAVYIPVLRKARRIAYTGSNDYHYRIREGSILHSGFSSENRAMSRRRLCELKENVRKYYPKQQPLMKYHEAFGSYQWAEYYIRCGGSKKGEEYKEIWNLFLTGFPLLFVQDGVPGKDKCKALLIRLGLFVPVRNAYLRLFRRRA